MSISTRILLGLVLGIASGLFFGEYCAPLQVVGDAFISLLQMTVLPYIMVALMSGIGGLNVREARRLALYGGTVMIGLWVVGLLVISLLPLALPEFKTGAFFSTALLQEPETQDVLALYIPANPFHSLANNVVPAVVLFSIAVGIALMNVANKQRFIEPLSVLTTALTKVNGYVVRVAPLGVFALAASASGTITLAEFARLQGYLITYVLAALILGFGVLPGLLVAFTPFSYREVVRISKDALVTGFTTGNLFILIPMLNTAIKQLFHERDLKHEEIGPSVDVILPVAFSFPALGKLVSLLFVPFGAWFVNSELSIGQYPTFITTGLMSFFGSSNVAMPFLLDFMRLPSDLFNLFVIAGVICLRFGVVASAMHLLVLTALTTCVMTGFFRLRPARLVTFGGLTAVVLLVAIIGTRGYLGRSLQGQYDRDEILTQMQLLHDPVPATRLREAAPNPVPLRDGQTRLQRIRDRGVIRIGFHDLLPFSYFNADDQLVGLDIELAHRLAEDLGTSIEFVPIQLDRLAEHFAADHCDLVMSAVALTPPLMELHGFAGPYMDVTLALVVPDYRRHDFRNRDAIRKLAGLRIAAPAGGYWKQRLDQNLPDAEVVSVDSNRHFFEDPDLDDLDALLTAAEIGSAWTLLYPGYAVVIPAGEPVRQPIGYPVAGRDRELIAFMNHWIDFTKKRGVFQKAYDYWILGREAGPSQPRWSVMRDVLGWGRDEQ